MKASIFSGMKNDSGFSSGCCAFLFLLLTCACGSKDSGQQPGEHASQEQEALNTRDALKGEGNPRGHHGVREEDSKESKRSRYRNQMRKWASTHLYMDLTLKHFKLSDDQLAQITEMNWRHFNNLLENSSHRPQFEDALLHMMLSGKIDEQKFYKYRAWIEENTALLKKQYLERMTTLHKILSEKQRTELVKFVKRAQMQKYAKLEKQLEKQKEQRPMGCGGMGRRFTNKFTRGLQLTRDQESKLLKFEKEVQQKNPSLDQIDDYRTAQKVFDKVLRKIFVLDAFDVSKLSQPRLEYKEPSSISLCHQQEFQLLLEILSDEQRLLAAEKFKAHLHQRRGVTPDAGLVDGGAL